MHNSILGILSLILGLAGLFLCGNIWGAIPCILAIIVGIVGLTDYLAYKWSSIAGICLAIMGLSLLGYQIFENKVVILPIITNISTQSGDDLAKDNIDKENPVTDLNSELIQDSQADPNLQYVFEIDDPSDRFSTVSNLKGAYDGFSDYLKSACAGDSAKANSYIDSHYYDKFPRTEEMTNEVYVRTYTYIYQIHNAMLLLNREVANAGYSGYKVKVTIKNVEIPRKKMANADDSFGVSCIISLFDQDDNSLGSEAYDIIMAYDGRWKVIGLLDE